MPTFTIVQSAPNFSRTRCSLAQLQQLWHGGVTLPPSCFARARRLLRPSWIRLANKSHSRRRLLCFLLGYDKKQQGTRELWEFPTAYCRKGVGFMVPRRLGGCYFCTFAPGFQPPILHLAKLIWHLCWTTTTTRSVFHGEDLPAIPARADSGRSPGTEASTPVRAVETKRISRGFGLRHRELIKGNCYAN